MDIIYIILKLYDYLSYSLNIILIMDIINVMGLLIINYIYYIHKISYL